MGQNLVMTGMVLNAMPIGDYDKRITLLTRERGKITAFARGARKPNSQFLAATNPFSIGEFELFDGRSTYTVAKVSIQNYFRELAADFNAAYYGYYFLELADYFGQEGIDEKESMNLLYVTVKALLNPNIDDRLVRCIFELRMMAAQGLCPSLFHCVCCERQPVEGEELFFSQQNHGILDKACLGHVNDAKRISAPALYAMQYIVTASLGKLYTFTVTEEVLHELERHIHTYIAANTEKRFKSLEILEIMS